MHECVHACMCKLQEHTWYRSPYTKHSNNSRDQQGGLLLCFASAYHCGVDLGSCSHVSAVQVQ
jgi:hypothetical protein